MMEPIIRNIADTALWVAVYRADETERSDAVFHDRFAKRLAGERGYKIVETMEAGRKNSWSFISRTWLFDDFVMRHAAEGFDMVINLASGLDTRPYRLNLPAALKWVDVDLPEMTGYMHRMMAGEKPACVHERISLDLSDREARINLFRELGCRGNKILVFAEGLMVYLDETAVGALAYDLSREPHFMRLLIDLSSPSILPMIRNEMGSLLDDAKAPILFAPEEGEDFFRLFKWKHLESVSKLKTAAKLQRLSPEMMGYAAFPEPEGPRRPFPWSGVCLFENAAY